MTPYRALPEAPRESLIDRIGRAYRRLRGGHWELWTVREYTFDDRVYVLHHEWRHVGLCAHEWRRRLVAAGATDDPTWMDNLCRCEDH